MLILAPREQPRTRPIDSKISQTVQEVSYVFEDGHLVYRVLIEAGFKFDGASIPRLFWSLLGLAPHGAMDGPAVPHDKGYGCRGKFPRGAYQQKIGDTWIDVTQAMPKHKLDELLKDLCLHFKVCSKRKARLIYWAVSVFGWWAWYRKGRK